MQHARIHEHCVVVEAAACWRPGMRVRITGKPRKTAGDPCWRPDEVDEDTSAGPPAIRCSGTRTGPSPGSSAAGKAGRLLQEAPRDDGAPPRHTALLFTASAATRSAPSALLRSGATPDTSASPSCAPSGRVATTPAASAAWRPRSPCRVGSPSRRPTEAALARSMPRATPGRSRPASAAGTSRVCSPNPRSRSAAPVYSR